MDAAIGTLDEERGGVGSALIQAVRMVGGSFGAAILGSVLNAGYRGRLDLTGLAPAAARAVREGVYGGLEVAHRTGREALAGQVRAAYTHGMDLVLLVSAVLGLLCVLGSLLLPSRRAGRVGPAGSERPQSDHEAAV
jgi:hypothetical protein